jgi:hypothetical protein
LIEVFVSLSSSKRRNRLSKLFKNDSRPWSLSFYLVTSTSSPSTNDFSSLFYCLSKFRSSLAFWYCFWSCLKVYSVSNLCDSTDLIDLNWSWEARALKSSRSRLTFSRAESLASSCFFVSIRLFYAFDKDYSLCLYSIFNCWSSLFKRTNSLLRNY